MRKIFKKIIFVILILFFLFAAYFFIGSAEPAKDISWGVNFSQKHPQSLGLDWKETFTALLDDLGVRHLKLAAHWDLLEREKGQYNFNDLDWQIEEAGKRGADILFVIGMKTPRWPECHIPEWAKNLNKEEQQDRILKLLEEIVIKYRSTAPVWAWQVENEPFFNFGECPWTDKEFLKKEISLVKSLDVQNRPVVVSESGEFPLWIMAARYGDIVGATMYKKVWFKEIKTYLTYPFPPVFYHRKAEIVRKLFGKEVIGIELQAEPWCPTLIYDCLLDEQKKTMNLEQFKYNTEFAKKTGISRHYLWGAEWIYWLKENQGQSEIWQEAQKLFKVEP